MQIKKAVISCAGFGTRFLPISKTIQKEMLPILTRPIVDYVVEDCIKAGIKEIIFVINKHNYQVLHFYQENKRLYKYLKKMNKVNLYDKVAHLHAQANFHFIKQTEQDLYGTAVPVLLAADFVKDEDAFLYLGGDDFIYNSDQSSEVAKMIDLFNQSQAKALVTCISRDESELHLYGIAEIEKNGDLMIFKNFIEKPELGQAPSNLANISKFILTPQIIDIIKKQKVNPKSGELYFTDSIIALSKNNKVIVHETTGEYLDGGNLLNWLKANLTIAKENKSLYQELKKFIKKEYFD